MADGEHGQDERESREPAVLQPIGEALRSTYDAENHDSLDSKLTGLMLELARVGDEAPVPRVPAPPVPAPPVPVAAVAAPPPPASPSWLQRLLFGR